VRELKTGSSEDRSLQALIDFAGELQQTLPTVPPERELPQSKECDVLVSHSMDDIHSLT
jgi:hypothetical protein